ncbi:MAG: hypothetical protein WDW38_005061 [Sanguina aurantia]
MQPQKGQSLAAAAASKTPATPTAHLKASSAWLAAQQEPKQQPPLQQRQQQQTAQHATQQELQQQQQQQQQVSVRAHRRAQQLVAQQMQAAAWAAHVQAATEHMQYAMYSQQRAQVHAALHAQLQAQMDFDDLDEQRELQQQQQQGRMETAALLFGPPPPHLPQQQRQQQQRVPVEQQQQEAALTRQQQRQYEMLVDGRHSGSPGRSPARSGETHHSGTSDVTRGASDLTQHLAAASHSVSGRERRAAAAATAGKGVAPDLVRTDASTGVEHSKLPARPAPGSHSPLAAQHRIHS